MRVGTIQTSVYHLSNLPDGSDEPWTELVQEAIPETQPAPGSIQGRVHPHPSLWQKPRALVTRLTTTV